MANFVDEYQVDLISTQMKNLQISNKQININKQLYHTSINFQEKFQIFKQAITESYKKSQLFKYQSKSMDIEAVENIFTRFKDQNFTQFQITTIGDFFNPNFFVLSKIKIRKQIRQIIVYSTLIKNGVPLIIKCKAYKNLLCRYLNKLNSTFRYGSFRLDPFNGSIVISLCSQLNVNQFQELIFQPNKGNKYIEQQLQTTKNFMKYNFHKILYLINELPENYTSILSVKKYQVRKFGSEPERILNIIQKSLKICTFQYDFMFKPELKKTLTERQEKQIKQKSGKRRESSLKLKMTVKPLNEKLQQFLEFYKVYKKEDIQISNTFEFQRYFQAREKQFIKQLTHPVAKVNNKKDKIDIFAEIYIEQPPDNKIKWQVFAQGGFSSIARGKASFWYFTCPLRDNIKKTAEDQVKYKIMKKTEQDKLTKFLVKKDDKSANSKISHQKDILKLIKNYSCVVLPKFYQTYQTAYLDSLFMDFYASKSLQHYKRQNQEVLSLWTKIHILCQAIQGLRFLRDYKIVHLDIKPQNILIGNTLIVKICDFGESYHESVCKKQFHPGFTMPYAAPEVFLDEIPFSQKLDVFSFGVMMHEILFESYPMEQRRMTPKRLVDLYKQKNYLSEISINSERLESYGPTQLIRSLCNLCLKCMDPILTKRPCLDWIYLILRNARQYLGSLY